LTEFVGFESTAPVCYVVIQNVDVTTMNKKATKMARTFRHLFVQMTALAVFTGFCSLAFAQSPDQITLDNAYQVKLLATIDKRIKEAIPGPGRNEVTLYLAGGAVQIVDDQNFQLKRKVDKKMRNRFTPSRAPGYVSWLDGKNLFVQFADGTQKKFPRGETAHNPVLSPDHSLAAVGDAISTENEGDGFSRVRVYDVKSGKLIHDLDAGNQGWSAVRPQFSPDGKLLAVGSRNYRMRLFDVASGKLLHEFPKRRSHDIAFSPDGKTIAAAYVDGTLATWDVKSGRLRCSTKTDCEELYRVSWNQQGDLLLTGGTDGSITLWNPKSLGVVKHLMPSMCTRSAYFTHDGTRLLITSSDKDQNKFSFHKHVKMYVWSVSAAAPNDGN